MKEYPSQEYLRECFTYIHEDGTLIWNERPVNHFKNNRAFSIWNSRYKGTKAGKIGTHGGRTSRKKYLTISINKSLYLAHRIVYIYVYGVELSSEIDHINGDGLDNRISNLRQVSRVENCMNIKMRSDSTSGVMGVSFDKKSKKWHAYISKNKKRITIGYFDCISEARKARKSHEISLGYHIQHGVGVSNEN